jgi:hypothetical protein
MKLNPFFSLRPTAAYGGHLVVCLFQKVMPTAADGGRFVFSFLALTFCLEIN